MAQATLVDTRIWDGDRLIERLAAKGIEVTAGCWVKESESSLWWLYVVTPLVGRNGSVRAVYRRVGPVIQEMRKEGIRIDPLEVKVIGPDDPLARAVLSVREQHGERKPIWYQGDRLGPLAVETAYIYPSRAIVVLRFEYERRGETTHWDATTGHLLPCALEERWAYHEPRVGFFREFRGTRRSV